MNVKMVRRLYMKNTEVGIEAVIHHIMYLYDIDGDPENICANNEKEMPNAEDWKFVSKEDIDGLMTTNCRKCKKLLTYKVLRSE